MEIYHIRKWIPELKSFIYVEIACFLSSFPIFVIASRINTAEPRYNAHAHNEILTKTHFFHIFRKKILFIYILQYNILSV